MLKNQSRFVNAQSVILFEDDRGNRAVWCCRERMFPPFDARDYGKMLARVFLRQDAGSRFVQPLVAACVIESAVGVDQASRVRADPWPKLRKRIDAQ